jgi:hypothetical protein
MSKKDFVLAWLGAALGVLLCFASDDLELALAGHSTGSSSFHDGLSNVAVTLIVMAGAGLAFSGLTLGLHRILGKPPTLSLFATAGIALFLSPDIMELFRTMASCNEPFLVCYLTHDLPMNMQHWVPSIESGIFYAWAMHVWQALLPAIAAFVSVRAFDNPTKPLRPT